MPLNLSTPRKSAACADQTFSMPACDGPLRLVPFFLLMMVIVHCWQLPHHEVVSVWSLVLMNPSRIIIK